MTRILIPRSDNLSAKKVEASDFEKYFSCDIINDYVICGLCVTEQCPDILAVDITSGNARLKGLHLENTSCCSVTGLVACNTNKIYLHICRDGCAEPDEWTFGTTIGCLPADSIQIATVVTDCATVTSVSQVADTDVIKSIGTICPIGTISMFGGDYCKVPTGWLLADGSCVSQSTYSNLFDVIGFNFGGSGCTCFTLPNLIATFPRGAPACTNPGGTGGADTVTISISQMPVHTHIQNSHVHSQRGTGGSADYNALGSLSGASQNTGSTTAVNQNTGGGTSHENKPPFLSVICMIKT